MEVTGRLFAPDTEVRVNRLAENVFEPAKMIVRFFISQNNFREVWGVRSESFEPFWKDESPSAKQVIYTSFSSIYHTHPKFTFQQRQIRIALIRTSLEDLATSFPNAALFVPAACPELVELESFDVDKVVVVFSASFHR